MPVHQETDFERSPFTWPLVDDWNPPEWSELLTWLDDRPACVAIELRWFSERTQTNDDAHMNFRNCVEQMQHGRFAPWTPLRYFGYDDPEYTVPRFHQMLARVSAHHLAEGFRRMVMHYVSERCEPEEAARFHRVVEWLSARPRARSYV